VLLKTKIGETLTKVKKVHLIYIIVFVFCISYSLFRFFFIDINGSIHIHDGYLIYSKLMETFLQSGSFKWYNSWFSEYNHKNRILLPLFVSIFSTITFIPPLISGMIISALSYLLTFYYLTKISEEKLGKNYRKKIFLLFFSSSVVMTNFLRFATDGLLILFITISFYYYIKWNKEKKKYYLLLFIISQLFAILARESAILLSMVFIFYSIRKKKYQVIVYLSTIIFVVVSAFINIRETSLLFIILKNIFIYNIANDLSKGTINITMIFEYTISKFNCEYIFYLFSSIIYSFFAFTFFSIYALVQKESKEKYKLEKILILVYSIFLIFIYNGRILGRFLLPVFIFLIYPTIEGIRQVVENIEQKNLENMKKIKKIIFKFANSEKKLILFCISTNYIIAIARLIFSILLI